MRHPGAAVALLPSPPEPPQLQQPTPVEPPALLGLSLDDAPAMAQRPKRPRRN